ncbi:leukocyte receptor cluster member 1 [Telopea speciosissima]|uniref:leukocyte receptor cluster member 1 n=1 Tax=Telopea speciosissima TaxID=54955 RepID=UPI001CC3EEAF|nr:leukocyte receptor cluster member 1 [Telopea speciosissima]XP_043715849.1 leukocyte receptor cluster member 1 [Telopea speciosissima]XP_043715850.1 leukocyte receptor cluster member 1 [Telopea speciosissima]
MGGHGGLNILPQKRWNVYNFDNREKVRLDEEAAAREEQLKLEQTRKCDAEFRLERLRQNRGLPPAAQVGAPVSSEQKSSHINLFEGLKIFPSLGTEEEKDVERDSFKKKKAKKEEKAPTVVLPEDEKYRLGYGIAGKGVKKPWYLLRPSDDVKPESDRFSSGSGKPEESKKSGKKTLEELREERVKREKREKERERALLLEKKRRDRANVSGKGFSRHGL